MITSIRALDGIARREPAKYPRHDLEAPKEWQIMGEPERG